MVEGSTEKLIHGLSYVETATAEYVKDRSSVTFVCFPTGGNTYSPSGVRLLRFEMVTNGDEFMDPGSVRLAFTLVNVDSTKTLRLLSNNPLVVCQRLRILARGSVVEDIPYLHRNIELPSILLPPQRRKTLAMQMMGEIVGRDATFDMFSEGVPANSDRRVLVSLPSGFLSATQQRFLPLKMCAITVELEINANVVQCLDTTDAHSTNWAIQDAQIKADLVTVLPSIATPIYDLINSGEGLTVAFHSYNTTLNMVPGVTPVNGQISTQFSKSYNDSTTVFFTFGTPEFPPVNDRERIRNETNAFFYPSRSEPKDLPGAGRPYLPVEDRIEAQVHIGSKAMPQYPTRSLAEMSFRLMQAVGLTASAEGMAIHPARYREDQFVLAFDCERAGSDPAGVSYTGINTSAGNATIRLEMKGLNAYPGNPVEPSGSQIVDRVYCHIVHSVKVAIQGGGVSVSEG